MPSIYGLYDASGAQRYIGKANDPPARLLSHMRDARRRQAPLHRWLREHGKPQMKVLEADCEDWQEAERRLIALHRARGADLLNLASGGNQPFCPRDVASANGAKLMAMLRANPRLMRVRELKRNMAHALKRGWVNDEARESLRYAAARCPSLFGSYRDLPNADGSPCHG